MSDLKKHIEALVKKAAEAHESGDAQRFAQAATNAAQTFAILHNCERDDHQP